MGRMLDKYREQIGYKTADIIYRLIKRARIPRNRPVYELKKIDSDKVPGWKGPEKVSMLDFFLIVDEFPDLYIGRFLFNDQQSVTDPKLLPAHVVFKRETGEQIVDPIRIPVKDEIMGFYTGFLDKICQEGDDPTTYGETVHADADVIYHINDRVMSGKAIAESKLNDPDYEDAIRENLDKPSKLAEILRDSGREEVVVAEARRIVEANITKEDRKRGIKFNADHAEEFVRWMMRITLRVVEVGYLQKKLA